eukprot:367273-Pyramimonas_sp.AAC.1
MCIRDRMNTPWAPRSDLLCARVLGALFTDKFRAHKDSVVQCKDGAWRPVEELDERTLRLLEESVARAVRLLVCLVRNGVARQWVMLCYRFAPSTTRSSRP